MDILLKSAQVWKSLLNVSAYFTYLKKDKDKNQEISQEVKIIFDKADFYHLAGFQYLNDVQIPKTSRNKIIDAVINGVIKIEHIEKSEKYLSMIEPRLLALSKLQDGFEFIKGYSYNPRWYSFYTAIKADYVLEFKIKNDEYFFLFIITNDIIYYCTSIFMEDPNRNYRQGQKLLWSASNFINT